MPISSLGKGRYRWGAHGKVGTKAEASEQMRAAYANGYRPKRKRSK